MEFLTREVNKTDIVVSAKVLQLDQDRVNKRILNLLIILPHKVSFSFFLNPNLKLGSTFFKSWFDNTFFLN